MLLDVLRERQNDKATCKLTSNQYITMGPFHVRFVYDGSCTVLLQINVTHTNEFTKYSKWIQRSETYVTSFPVSVSATTVYLKQGLGICGSLEMYCKDQSYVANG